MPISLLRRPSRQREPDVPPAPPAIGQLSLPDVTKPLIDAASWAAMPRVAPGVDPTAAGQQINYGPPPSSNGHGGDAPNTGALGVSPPNARYPYGYASDSYHSHSRHSHSSLSSHDAAGAPGAHPPPQAAPQRSPSGPDVGRMPSRVRDANGNPLTSFHRPFGSPTGSPASNPPSAFAGTKPLVPRRSKTRRQAALTIMVVGPTGSGKTSFIDALTGVLDPAAPRAMTRAGPTTSVLRHEIVSARERRSLVILDTPGLPPPAAEPAKRGRALGALIGIVEDRLAHQLSEESKVVRRKADGAELVTLIVYVVDARTVLVQPPTIEIDWDAIAEPPAKGARPESRLLAGDVDARFPVEDIEAIRRFSVRGNVLPVLTHADALTTNELLAVQAAVVRDLTTVFGRDPLGAWGILSASPGPDMDDDGDEHAADTPHTNTPYAVFAPEGSIAGPVPGFSRTFRWGAADAADAAHSDLRAICDALMAATDWLRTSTREGVYEKFRTEKLLTARGVRPQI